jgi:actin-related protein 8
MPTRKFQCKVYEEVFLAPLCLIFPGVLDADRKASASLQWYSENIIDDIADEAGVSLLDNMLFCHAKGVQCIDLILLM